MKTLQLSPDTSFHDVRVYINDALKEALKDEYKAIVAVGNITFKKSRNNLPKNNVTTLMNNAIDDIPAHKESECILKWIPSLVQPAVSHHTKLELTITNIVSTHIVAVGNVTFLNNEEFGEGLRRQIMEASKKKDKDGDNARLAQAACKIDLSKVGTTDEILERRSKKHAIYNPDKPITGAS